MTKKSAKKLAARARQEAKGGHYQHHLRCIEGPSAPPPEAKTKRIPESPRLIFTTVAGEQTVLLSKVDTLGRDPKSTVQLLDKIVAREHCHLESKAGSLVLRDLGSLNGTYVNGERVRGERTLMHGDEIALGATRARYDDGTGPLTFAMPPVSPGVALQLHGGTVTAICEALCDMGSVLAAAVRDRDGKWLSNPFILAKRRELTRATASERLIGMLVVETRELPGLIAAGESVRAVPDGGHVLTVAAGGALLMVLVSEASLLDLVRIHAGEAARAIERLLRAPRRSAGRSN